MSVSNVTRVAAIAAFGAVGHASAANVGVLDLQGFVSNTVVSNHPISYLPTGGHSSTPAAPSGLDLAGYALPIQGASFSFDESITIKGFSFIDGQGDLDLSQGSISVVTLTDLENNITRTIAFGNAISAQSLQDFDGTISEQVKQAIAGQLGFDTFEDVLDNLSDVVDLDNVAIDNHPPLTVSAPTPSAALAGLGLMGLMGTRRRRKA